MQHYKILRKNLRYFLFVMFVCAVTAAVSGSAFSKNGTVAFGKESISADSISKVEIAEFRKSFESVEKMVNNKRGTYDEAKRNYDALKGNRVRNLPEFAGRFSAVQQKLTAWQTELNPKQPPVVVPNNPSNPRNTGKTNETAKPVETTTGEIERKSSMISYFPDTLTVGNDFLAYVEISRGNISFNNNSGNVNWTLDSVMISTSGLKPQITNTAVTVDLSMDGGNQNFTINPRSDSKTKTISDGGDARWEWTVHPNSEGEYRLRLTVKYQKPNKDGSMQETNAITKVFVVKGLPRKVSEPASNMLWIALGLLALIIIVAVVLMSGRNKRNKYRNDQVRNEQVRNEQIRNEQIRKDQHRNDVNR
jgi:hypothetical protein